MIPPTVREYYCKKYAFDDVDFLVGGRTPDPLDQLGLVYVRRGKWSVNIEISELLWQQGYDGVEDIFNYMAENFDRYSLLPLMNELWPEPE